MALAWTLLIAALRVYRQHGGGAVVYIVGGGVIAAVLIWLFSVDVAAEKRATQQADREAVLEEELGETFPVPPMDLPHYHGILVAQSQLGELAAADQELTPASITEVTGA